MRPVALGETFELRRGKRVDTFRREPDPDLAVGGYGLRVTHLSRSDAVGFPADGYTFDTEQEWFRQRGFVAVNAAVAAEGDLA